MISERKVARGNPRLFMLPSPLPAMIYVATLCHGRAFYIIIIVIVVVAVIPYYRWLDRWIDSMHGRLESNRLAGDRV